MFERFKIQWNKLTGTKTTKEVVHKQVQEATARDPKKTRIKTLGQAMKTSGGGEFEASAVDLEEIKRAYNTDSYIKRAVDKYTDLMFKNGWDISSRNENASEYVWTRLKLMSEAKREDIEQLLTSIAQDLVLYGNAFVVKSRQNVKSANTGVNAVGYLAKAPVVGYFVLSPETIQISRDENGTVIGYQQKVGGGEAYDIKPEDMAHITFKKPTGYAFGMPFIHNVLDDVKMLRQIEENVARLIYRNLFPLYVYQVGLDKPGFEATDEEIEEIREQIREMPMDGGIVVPERHKISTVGSEGSALDAEGYLKYYRQRVFTGLAVSDSVMGVGDSANKSTSDNHAADLFDGVKEFQRVFQRAFEFLIINELLFEGGFDPILNPDDEVHFTFAEIQLDAKIKIENHAVQLFMQNAITHEEMRAMMGLDPISDEGRLFFNMIGAVQAAQATAGAASAGENDNKPENQHVKKDSPGNPKRESDSGDTAKTTTIEESLQENSPNGLTDNKGMVNLTSELTIEGYYNTMKTTWGNLRDDVVSMLQAGRTEAEIKGFATELVRRSLRAHSNTHVKDAMNRGVDSARVELNKTINPSLSFNLLLDKISNESTKYVDRLINDVDKLISKAYVEKEMKDKVTNVMGAFNSNEYRLSFIAKTELYRAYNYGRAVAAKEAGLQNVTVHHENGCNTCMEKAFEEISLTGVDLIEALPPHHPNCTCLVKLNMPAEEV